MRPKKVVLCVSADEEHLSLQRFFLETRGFRVVSAESAEHALEMLKHVLPGSVDVLVTELELWQMDGNTLARRVKEMHPGLPVLLFSYTATVFDHGTSADVFLPRGCTAPAMLLERIRILATRKPGPKKQLLPAVWSDTQGTQERVVA